MPKFFVKNGQINNNQITILGEDVNHIANVLRMKVDEIIQVCNVDTTENFNAKITSFEKDKITCFVIEKIKSEAESDINLTIFQGIPKSDKMELIIQKSTELGVKAFVPVDMERCVSKISKKDEEKKIGRWQKISEVAAKQSGRDIIPKIKNIMSIKDICKIINQFDMIIVPYEKAEGYSFKDSVEELKQIKKKNISIGVVIGPEGGFEISEIETMKEAGVKVVTLGKRILRTETVALAMSSVIMYELGGSI
ncbi:MAG: 16S rRNA (uracil(1498)-N(3))-methyltransferase [Clostridia bacterium]|nr:16S rRNA (uracil(1498)-N(3))-methyltransferase [Clostridia bacterium]